MTFLISALVFTLSSAALACPNFGGSYVNKEAQAHETMMINQVACDSMTVTLTVMDGHAPKSVSFKLILDGVVRDTLSFQNTEVSMAAQFEDEILKVTSWINAKNGSNALQSLSEEELWMDKLGQLHDEGSVVNNDGEYSEFKVTYLRADF